MRAALRSLSALLLAACGNTAPLAQPPVIRPVLPPSKAPARGATVPIGLPPSPEATPAPTSAPALTPPSSIGEAGPVQLLSASSSGDWVAWCDVTTKTAKLALGATPPAAIDNLLASDPTGRYVVVTKAGSAWLEDAQSGAAVDLTALGADVRRIRVDYSEHRTLSFDAKGQHLAYLAKRGADTRVIVRKLADGSEQTFSPGPGEVFRLELSADARYVTLDVLREDSNHNGKLDWPVPPQAPEHPCQTPSLPRFRTFAYQGRGDAVSRAALAVGGGALREVPGLVTPLGAELLVRAPDGSLLLEAGGKRTQLADASCAGRVLFADSERGLVVVTCTPPPPKQRRGSLPLAPSKATPGGKRQVWLLGRGFQKNLESELYETNVDASAVLGARLLPLYPGSDSALLDLERRELLPLVTGSRVLATEGPRAVLWRGNDLFLYDALTKTERPLAHGAHKTPSLLRAGSSVLLSPFVVVSCSEPAFRAPAPALALSAAGFVLTSSPAPSDAPSRLPSGAIQGPLRWVDARLPPPDGPPR